MLSHLFVVVCICILFITTSRSQSIYIDDQLATYISNYFNTQLRFNYVPNAKFKFLVQSPFKVLKPALYDSTKWRQNNAASVSPEKRWADLIDQVPTPDSVSAFKDSGSKASDFWRIFVEKYEWDDLAWKKQKNCGSCRFNYNQTLLNMEALMQTSKNYISLRSACGANSFCVFLYNGKIKLNNIYYELMRDQMNKEQALDINFTTRNPEKKIVISKQYFIDARTKDVGADANLYYYAVRFEPYDFLDQLSLLNSPARNSFVSTWALDTYSFYNVTHCTFDLNSASANLLGFPYSKLVTVRKVMLFHNVNLVNTLKSVGGREVTCVDSTLTIKGGTVDVVRPWINLDLFNNQNLRVYPYTKGSWSDGSFGGQFPAIITNFLISNDITVTSTSTNRLLSQITNPTVAGYVVKATPYFPNGDSIYFQDVAAGNNTLANVPSSRSIFKMVSANTTVECGDYTAKCYIKYNIFDSSTVVALNTTVSDIAAVESTTYQTMYSFDSQANSVFTVLIVILLFEYLFVFLWPFLIVVLCVLNFVNLCIIGKKETGPSTAVVQQLKMNNLLKFSEQQEDESIVLGADDETLENIAKPEMKKPDEEQQQNIILTQTDEEEMILGYTEQEEDEIVLGVADD